MPSTFSPLKIQLMQTGENALQWGDITNKNLNALTEAITGSVDVTFASANVTLTLSNIPDPQAARNFRISCVGTTGGAARNLTVPANPTEGPFEKAYVIMNYCGDPVIVKTAAQATGVTVPAGRSAMVFCDGVNVVELLTNINNLNVSGAFSTANITATNATVTNLTANNITTVAPSGNVVIGRGGQLQIASADGSANTSIIYNPLSDLRFWNNGDRMIINTTGVGIGRSPGTSLDVAGIGRFISPGSGTTGGVIVLAGGGGESILQFANNGFTAEFSHISSFAPGHVRYQAQGGGVHYFVTNNAERMRINSNGYVGIGTASPEHHLHVTGNVGANAFYGSAEGLSGSAAINVSYANNAGNSYACSGNSATATTASDANALGGQVPSYYFNRAVDQWKTSADGKLRVLYSNNSNTYYGTGAGHVWRNASDQDIMTLDGAGSIYAYGDITAYSDRKLKTNLEPITDALDKVQALTGYTYDRIDDPEGRRHVGLIAQDVQAVLPEAVLDHDGTLTLAYGNMVALLVEAVKELREEIAYLKGYGK